MASGGSRMCDSLAVTPRQGAHGGERTRSKCSQTSATVRVSHFGENVVATISLRYGYPYGRGSRHASCRSFHVPIRAYSRSAGTKSHKVAQPENEVKQLNLS